MSGRKSDGLSYKDAGVDIDAGNALVARIAPLAAATRRAGSMDGLGGFGGFFDPAAAGYRDPLLVGATDGVGTKLKIAIDTGRHDSIGIDLVAMCVNDLVVQGAEPLFFLDYFASSHLDGDVATAVIAGIAEGCRTAGCALIGGETAEMPGLYGAGDYDLAGFAVGAVERDRLLRGEAIADGDVLLALGSSGLHSNGFSLVRRVSEAAGLGYGDDAPFAAGLPLGEALLTPTRIYVKVCLGAHRAGLLNGLAHITGGGLAENLARILPAGRGADIDLASWELPPLFRWLGKAGRLAGPEMLRTFNAGVGMVAVVPADRQAQAIDYFTAGGEVVWPIGAINSAPATDSPITLSAPPGHWYHAGFGA